MNREDEDIKCGELFCENCGDCYTCFADDECPSGNHYFPFGDLEKEKTEIVEGEK